MLGIVLQTIEEANGDPLPLDAQDVVRLSDIVGGASVDESSFSAGSVTSMLGGKVELYGDVQLGEGTVSFVVPEGLYLLNAS